MARDPRFDVLFEPVQLGPKTMRNRFMQVPQCHGVETANQPGFEAAFRGMKAEGGWAAVFTQACTIGPDADIQGAITSLWDEGDVRNLAALCDAVHEHESLAGIELWHGGPVAGTPKSRTGANAVASIPLPYIGGDATPRAMTKREIRELQHRYVEAFKRARAAGFDLLTLYAAHGVGFPLFFLMPLFNNRTDEYGGSFENRIRFTRELLEMVREEIDECAIGIRFGIDTLDEPYGAGDRGVRADGEGREFIAALDPLVDYWDLVTGTANWGENTGSSRFFDTNHEAKYTRIGKEASTKPVINVGRFTDPEVMLNAITSGQCDIIGAARPSISDPFLPLKIQEGRIDDIRECIGCNICVSRWESAGGPIWCTQNATSGEEARRGWHPERFTRATNADKDVLVLGAGPAGMECARVLGERQMRNVHILDAGQRMGGHLRWVTTLPGLASWGRVITYRQTQIDKLANVQFVPGQRLSLEDVLNYGAEYVVVATGSHWHPQGLQGFTFDVIPGADAALPHVLTPEQVVLDKKPVGERVVVYDADGYYMGASIAELLAPGRQVTYVTPRPRFAAYMAFTLEDQRQKETLRSLGVEIITEHAMTDIAPTGVELVDVETGEARAVASDSVVLVTQRVPDCEIYDQLIESPERLDGAGIKGLFVIGDAHTPAMIAHSVFSGHRLAREIDSADPAVPLPYVRERRLMQPREDDHALDGGAIRTLVGEPVRSRLGLALPVI